MPWKTPARAMNGNAQKYINESILKSKLPLHDVCIFNANDYMNLQRVYESSQIYLDEAKRETQDTSKLIDIFKTYCKSHIGFEDGHKIPFDDAFNVELYDPNEDKSIYGNVMLDSFPFDVSKLPIETYISYLSRRAILLGYNFVAYDVVKETSDKFGHKTAFVSIQFEASYFSSNIKIGSILYHVTPKSLASKVLSKGLLPSNKNTQGFSYGLRVYCFIDRHDEIMKWYANESGKQSKRFILTGNLKNDVKDFYEKLQEKTFGTLFDTREFAVLAIDTAKLDDVHFYRDNTFYIDDKFLAVYTDTAIRPNAISQIAEFTI